jgi:NTP pyrophosphatase (non-canonical NTP hydrolase)
MTTFEQLNKQIIEWAEARNIIKGATPIKQAYKTLEECGELIEGVSEQVTCDRIGHVYGFEAPKSGPKTAIADAIGDIVVTLCIQAKMQGLDIVECLQGAYNEIKDRRGKMVGGKFVKEADL